MYITFISIIRKTLGLLKEEHPISRHDLDHLMGTWEEKDVETFKQAIEPFEQIDRELWY